ncbi:MAG TPA: formylglycine-generating enzyme family protein [Candidatus Goldiibacteriota bacterium]|nr:formylglycine-generating enzyme family protein [Candidatus Goldiibacteriota bacterium]
MTITETETATEIVSATATSTITITATCTPTVTLTSTAANTPNVTQTAEESRVFVYVDGGTFTQTDSKKPQSFDHTISSFYIGKYQVTYELWYTVRQWALSNGYTFANAGREGEDATFFGSAPSANQFQPVTTINWRDAIVWCNAYSQKYEKTPVYYSDALLTTPIKNSADGSFGNTVNAAAGSVDNPYVNWNCDGYRLATEGEWEFAARYIDGTNWTPANYASGDSAPYDTSTTIGDYCWYSANMNSTTHDVGGKLPNALNIYDMSGNVYEWVWDNWADYPGDSTDYRGPAYSVSRICRSGYVQVDLMATGLRNASAPYTEYWGCGFRLARTQ